MSSGGDSGKLEGFLVLRRLLLLSSAEEAVWEYMPEWLSLLTLEKPDRTAHMILKHHMSGQH